MSTMLARTLGAALLAGVLASCGAPPAPNAGETASSETGAQTSIAISGARATPTPGGATVSAGYVTIANHGAEGDRLIAVASARAARVELHTMEMDGAVMRMRALEAVEVPAGGEARFEPGGRHLMFIDVAPPFAEGETIAVTLTFERAGAIEAAFPVSRREGLAH